MHNNNNQKMSNAERYVKQSNASQAFKYTISNLQRESTLLTPQKVNKKK